MNYIPETRNARPWFKGSSVTSSDFAISGKRRDDRYTFGPSDGNRTSPFRTSRTIQPWDEAPGWPPLAGPPHSPLLSVTSSRNPFAVIARSVLADQLIPDGALCFAGDPCQPPPREPTAHAIG